ncbi:lecithin retinol acyltransferase family protein [Pseudanabaena sp. FACHB-2040]|uniref:lecithin retinol acyltransferase family protein n=1 Tax=Pseudanabaena sp. FACHB-2040 TaxID=2692859 RepID=UPI001683DB5C|nr:lecithin retinol acyltransferase family protein [Pseudanabaena sp. FACHB-2040]MBD2257970.1 lecithin retinol acyltransferase family protein [Pseudanabaena sp. FACHB-2040]
MARGDQIYVMRELVGIPGLYEHHGIDCGDNTVIHYRKTGSEAVVTRTHFDTFAQGKPVYTVVQPVSFVPDVVMERAESRLGERRYDLFFNNCEHFANWCKTGRSESPQLANFGLRLEQLRLPEVRRLIENTAQDRSPEQAIALFQKALGDIAAAYQTLRLQAQQTEQEVDSWQRVAQKALQKQREDLARAALYKKVAAQKQVDALQTQLAELVDMQLTLLRNREISEERFRLG